MSRPFGPGFFDHAPHSQSARMCSTSTPYAIYAWLKLETINILDSCKKEDSDILRKVYFSIGTKNKDKTHKVS